MSTKQAKDRRRFFRISDAIGVTFDVIEAGDHEIECQAVNETTDQGISISDLLEQHNVAIEKALESLQNEQPKVAEALSEINNKLDTLLTLCELENLTGYSRYQHFEEASISACGIAFPISEILAPETKVRLNLYLLPSESEVTVNGRVVDCNPMDTEYYYLRVDFLEIEEEDRERLIQHIVQRQSSLLKSLREQMEEK